MTTTDTEARRQECLVDVWEQSTCVADFRVECPVCFGDLDAELVCVRCGNRCVLL